MTHARPMPDRCTCSTAPMHTSAPGARPYLAAIDRRTCSHRTQAVTTAAPVRQHTRSSGLRTRRRRRHSPQPQPAAPPQSGRCWRCRASTHRWPGATGCRTVGVPCGTRPAPYRTAGECGRSAGRATCRPVQTTVTRRQRISDTPSYAHASGALVAIHMTSEEAAATTYPVGDEKGERSDGQHERHAG